MLPTFGWRGSVSSAQILNSTDVTLKGVLGVKTMSLISQALGKDDDAKRYLVGILIIELSVRPLIHFFVGLCRIHGRELASLTGFGCVIFSVGTTLRSFRRPLAPNSYGGRFCKTRWLSHYQPTYR